MRPSMRRWLFLAVLVLALAACTPTPVLVSTPSPQASTPVGAVREPPPPPTPTPAPRATKEPSVLPPVPTSQAQMPPLLSLHMVDEQSGWALANRALLHTSDGGRHWVDVSPPGAANGSVFASVFLDAERAWAATSRVGNAVDVVYRTADGGRTWEASKFLPVFSSTVIGLSLDATDLSSAWLMVMPVGGMQSSPGALFRTSDGGEHWEQVASTQDTLPYGGRVRFADPMTGWLSGVEASTGPLLLSITRDGGRSWQAVELPRLPGHEDGRLDPGLPTFFAPGRQDALLHAQYLPRSGRASESAAIIYASHDGGRTWQATTPVRNGSAFDFVSADEGWVWAAEPHDSGSTAPVVGTLYHTRDGGQTWEPLSGTPGLDAFLQGGGDVLQLDFVSQDAGWAIVRAADGQTTQLVTTQDGGRSWDPVDAQVDGPEAAGWSVVDGWTGTIVVLDPGRLYDDYFLRADGERYGIDGSAGGLTAQIESARQQRTAVQVWGLLLTGVPDVNGRQIVVERLEVLGRPGAAATPTAIDADHRAFTDWRYGVSLQVPAGWAAVAGYGARYGGPDGYFDLGACSGALSIDEVTALEAGHHLQPYGSRPTIEKLTIQGQEARLILPSADQNASMENRAVLIVRYPVPVKGYGYFELGADQGHIRELAATLAFLTSVEAGPVDGWTGTLVKNCSMAQFDDYFQRDDGLRCGVAGATETVDVEIERLRCQPSAQVRVWGQLETETADTNGLRVVVQRLEVLSTPPSPTPWPGPSEEPVAGWEGYVIPCGEAGAERSFLRSDGARLGIDTQQAEALEALRLAECERYRVRIWGTLYRETAGPRIAAERVERIEVGTTAEVPTSENQP